MIKDNKHFIFAGLAPAFFFFGGIQQAGRQADG